MHFSRIRSTKDLQERTTRTRRAPGLCTHAYPFGGCLLYHQLLTIHFEIHCQDMDGKLHVGVALLENIFRAATASIVCMMSRLATVPYIDFVTFADISMPL
jgi:hypothetical protein